jgi:hypothetical protein
VTLAFAQGVPSNGSAAETSFDAYIKKTGAVVHVLPEGPPIQPGSVAIQIRRSARGRVVTSFNIELAPHHNMVKTIPQ